jgi:hypothetical protein
MEAGQTHRARGWLRALVRSPAQLREARGVDVARLAQHARAQPRLQTNLRQIALDVTRLTNLTPQETSVVTRVLEAWVSLNAAVGYTQGMHWVCLQLFRVLCGNPKHAECDTLAALSVCVRMHSQFTPVHPGDALPTHASRELSRAICDQVRQEYPRFPVDDLVDVLQIFVLRSFPVLFANVLEDAPLRVVWDFVFAHAPRSACRHAAVAMVLAHARLFTYGEDVWQDYRIFDTLLGLMTVDRAREIVQCAQHLLRVESLCGKVPEF